MCAFTKTERINDHSPLNSQIWPPSPVELTLASGGSCNSIIKELRGKTEEFLCPAAQKEQRRNSANVTGIQN